MKLFQKIIQTQHKLEHTNQHLHLKITNGQHYKTNKKNKQIQKQQPLLNTNNLFTNVVQAKVNNKKLQNNQKK